MRIPIDVYEALRTAADEDMRPVSQMAIKILKDQLRASGHLRGEPPARRRAATRRK